MAQCPSPRCSVLFLGTSLPELNEEASRGGAGSPRPHRHSGRAGWGAGPRGCGATQGEGELSPSEVKEGP